MKHIIIFIATITIIFYSCSSCKKQDNPTSDNPYGLPNATQTGEGIFACRINGKNFIAHFDNVYTTAGFRNDTLGLTGSDDTHPNYFEGISFGIYKNQIINQRYDFDDIIAAAAYGADSSCLGISSNVINVKAISGSITLTRLDKTAKIVSGFFNCKFPIPNCDTLKVTDGRFDFKYY